MNNNCTINMFTSIIYYKIFFSNETWIKVLGPLLFYYSLTKSAGIKISLKSLTPCNLCNTSFSFKTNCRFKVSLLNFTTVVYCFCKDR